MLILLGTLLLLCSLVYGRGCGNMDSTPTYPPPPGQFWDHNDWTEKYYYDSSIHNCLAFKYSGERHEILGDSDNIHDSLDDCINTCVQSIADYSPCFGTQKECFVGEDSRCPRGEECSGYFGGPPDFSGRIKGQCCQDTVGKFLKAAAGDCRPSDEYLKGDGKRIGRNCDDLPCDFEETCQSVNDDFVICCARRNDNGNESDDNKNCGPEMSEVAVFPDVGYPTPLSPPGITTRYYYDSSIQTCLSFSFLGGKGDGNNYESKESCEECRPMDAIVCQGSNKECIQYEGGESADRECPRGESCSLNPVIPPGFNGERYGTCCGSTTLDKLYEAQKGDCRPSIKYGKGDGIRIGRDCSTMPCEGSAEECQMVNDEFAICCPIKYY